MRAASRLASSTLTAVPLAGCLRPSFLRSSANFLRSSARSMASGVVPMIGTPAFFRASARFNGVCPPNWTITPQGLSFSTMFITSSYVTGSK